MFEIRLAKASAAREERRNASKLYHATTIHKLDKISSLVNWTTYVQNILTEELKIKVINPFCLNLTICTVFYSYPLHLQISPEEEIVMISSEYLGNLTSILESEPTRNVANYMMWRVVKSAVGFTNKDALEILEGYTR